MVLVKPQRPILNRNHPLVRGLVLDLGFWEGGGHTIEDLTKLGEDAVLSSPLAGSFVNGTPGLGYKCDVSNNVPFLGIYRAGGAPVCGHSDWTISLVMDVPPHDLVGNIYWMVEYKTSITTYSFLAGFDNVGNHFVILKNDSGTSFSVSENKLTKGFHQVVYQGKDDSILNIFVDGEKTATLGYTDPVGRTPEGHWLARGLWIPFEGIIYSDRAWIRALTPQEIASLYVNNNQIYQNLLQRED